MPPELTCKRKRLLASVKSADLRPVAHRLTGASLLTDRFYWHSISVYVVHAFGRKLRPLVLGTHVQGDDRKAPNTPSRTRRDPSRERGSVTRLI